MIRLSTLFLLSLSYVNALVGEYVLTSEGNDLFRRFIDEEGRYNMSFYHVNDFHARLDEINKYGDDCNRSTEACYGGYPRVRTIVSKGRRIHQDSLFLNMGDEFTGTSFFSHDKYKNGEVIAEALNMMGFDAMTLGNHEFDKGVVFLGKFLEAIEIPVISANIHATDPVLKAKIKPYKIFDKFNLAVIGATTPHIGNVAGTKFSDPIKTIQDTVNHIRSTTNITRIAAITHIGYEEDILLAQETTGLYLILGGHSHTPLGPMPKAEGDYPTIAKNKDGKSVFVVQAYRWGEWLGYIDVTFEADGTIHKVNGAPIELNERVAQDPELQAKVDKWKNDFEEANREVVGHSEVRLDHEACRTGECVLGNVITDAMFESHTKHNEPGQEPAAFAFLNGAGVRSTIGIGNVTYGAIERAFPFDNSVVEFSMSGQHLWDLFDGILRRVPLNDTSRKVTSFLQVSRQVRLRWNETERPGVGNLTSFKISGKPINLANTYKVLAIDFLTNGGDSFFVPELDDPSVTESLIDSFRYYLQKHDPVHEGIARIEGRLEPEKPPRKSIKCRGRGKGTRRRARNRR